MKFLFKLDLPVQFGIPRSFVSRQSSRTQLEVKCSVTLAGDYRLGGQLLIVPIEGQGRYKMKIRKSFAQHSIIFNFNRNITKKFF